MAFFGILIGLIVLAIPITVIFLAVGMSDVKYRLRVVERELAQLKSAKAAADQALSKPGAPDAAPARSPAPKPKAPEPALPPAKGISGPASAPPPQPAAAMDPAARTTTQPVTATPAPAPSGLRPPSFFDKALGWLQENWFYAVSAISLGLAGIFLVQYGIERGILTPTMRVISSGAFGLTLIAAGEYIRRRWGDGEDSVTAFLPSTLSAAGIVVLYAATIAARSLYGLIGPEVSFAALVAISGVAIVFGWFYGPFLAAAGLIGAAAAPFFVSSGSNNVDPLQFYYALIGTIALTIDAIRRWGWVSILGLVLAYVCGSLMYLAGGAFPPYMGLLVWLPLAAVALPRLQLWPTHPGRTVLEMILNRHKDEPLIPPTWIAAGAALASSAGLFVMSFNQEPAIVMLALFALTFLALALMLWAHKARGLSDLALIPVAAFLAKVVVEAGTSGQLYRELMTAVMSAEIDVPVPMTISILLALATAMSVAAAWRSFQGVYPALWAAAAALIAPATAVILELFWFPRAAIGDYFWAGHVIALAALMTVLAERFARADGDDKRRAAYAVLSALSLIALALFILLAQAALTVALSVLLVVAATLDKRFNLPEMRWFLMAGVATLGWRLIIDPGLDIYIDRAPLYEVLLAFGSALLGLGAAMVMLPKEGSRDTRAILESAIWAFGGVLATILLYRLVDSLIMGESYHWSAALFGLMWLGLALAQAYRIKHRAPLRWLRIALGAGYGLLATLAFVATLTVFNPYIGIFDDVGGPQPLDTLLVGYALPGLVFIALALRATWLPKHRWFGWVGAIFLAVYAFLAIRRFWQGNDMEAFHGFAQPEVYTHTVALLILGGALLYQAIARRSPGLRRIAMIVIGLTVAKVFFIDAGELTGLLRVFSFLALGLVLAGLALLNRWAVQQLATPDETPPETPAPEAHAE